MNHRIHTRTHTVRWCIYRSHLLLLALMVRCMLVTRDTEIARVESLKHFGLVSLCPSLPFFLRIQFVHFIPSLSLSPSLFIAFAESCCILSAVPCFVSNAACVINLIDSIHGGFQDDWDFGFEMRGWYGPSTWFSRCFVASSLSLAIRLFCNLITVEQQQHPCNWPNLNLVSGVWWCAFACLPAWLRLPARVYVSRFLPYMAQVDVPHSNWNIFSMPKGIMPYLFASVWKKMLSCFFFSSKLKAAAVVREPSKFHLINYLHGKWHLRQYILGGNGANTADFLSIFFNLDRFF